MDRAQLDPATVRDELSAATVGNAERATACARRLLAEGLIVVSVHASCDSAWVHVALTDLLARHPGTPTRIVGNIAHYEAVEGGVTLTACGRCA